MQSHELQLLLKSTPVKVLVVVLLLNVLTKDASSARKPCQIRDYGQNDIVCVCNSTYCDTVPKFQKITKKEFLVYTSDKSGRRFEQTRGVFFNREKNSKKEIFIDGTKTFQTILGWGGAFTDSTVITIKSLPEEAQDFLLKSYFSEDGIEYSLCRVPIGGNDFSTRGYTYDDGPQDPDLSNFKLAPEDFSFKIPLIQKALNISKNLKLFATPWTAPKWMKTNQAYNGFGCIRDDMYQSWANYFVKFFDSYQSHGIKFWGVTIGNEPINGWLLFKKLEVVAWPTWLVGNWVEKYLGPTIRNSNHSDIKIMILDDQRAYLPWYIVNALLNNNSSKYIDGIAVHWYLDRYIPASVLDMTHEMFPEKFILNTESSGTGDGEDTVAMGSWYRGELYSHDIIEDMRHWVSGWVDWNMALDTKGGPSHIDNFVDSSIIVNETSGEFYKQPMFYHMGHFSKFVPPGSIRIDSKPQHKNIEHVAFQRPDNGTVIVILNKRKRKVPFVINNNSKRKARVMLREKSITTVLYW